MNNLHNNLFDNVEWYNKWHNNPSYHLFHWSFFILFGALATFTTVSGINNASLLSAQAIMSGVEEEFQVARDWPTSIPLLTKELLSLNQQLRKAPNELRPELLQDLLSLARARKEAMEQSIQRDNSGDVMRNAVPQNLRSQMPEEVRLLVEERRRLSGKFEWGIADFEEEDRAENYFAIVEEKTQKRFAVHFADGEFPNAVTDYKVSGEAFILGDTAVMESSDLTVTEAYDLPSTTVKKVLVLLVNFTNDTSQPYTIDQTRNIMFTNTNSKNAFFNEVSFGKWSLGGKVRSDGDIYGYFTLDMDMSTSCDYKKATSLANSAAQNAGVDTSGYDNIMYVWAKKSSCGWGGWAYYGGLPGISYINGYLNSRTPAHELGHNYHMRHASSYRCVEDGVRVAISSNSANCKVSEYGDPFSVMGVSGKHYHFTDYHKGHSGTTISIPNWLDSQNILTVNRTQNPDNTYTIAPIEMGSTGVQSIKIPRDSSTFYYLEFRQPYGFDNFSSTSEVVNGVTIRISPGSNTGPSYLIDTTPETTSFIDAPLTVGRTFSESIKGINITTLSVSPSGAQVRIFFDAGVSTCTNTLPSLSISPSSQSGSAGQTLSYSFTLKNNDASDCTTSTYSLSSSLPSGWSITPSSFLNESLAPGSSVTRSFSVTSSESASTNNYTLSLMGTNTSNTTLKTTSSATYQVVTEDTTPPTVAVTKPADGSTVPNRGNIDVTVIAGDESGIADITIYLNNSLIKSCKNSTSCAAKYQAGRVPLGGNVIKAVARDKSTNSNTAEANITVYK